MLATGATALHRGHEVVGIAGVSGNGQSELALALAGLMDSVRGRITLGGKEIQELSPRAVSELGLTHVPEDRHKMGILLPFSLADTETSAPLVCALSEGTGKLASVLPEACTNKITREHP